MVSSDEIREKYLRFFEKKDHARIAPAPLVLESDPTTLFTSAGMQPLVPYLKGQVHPQGKRLVDSQPSLRLGDIEEVGDNRHLTYFEMLGNWSLGDYFKKDQLTWCWEFYTQELGLPAEKLWVSVFEGDGRVSRDTESFEIWRGLGVPEERIRFYGANKNWWSRSGSPEKMSVGDIGGPDSEVFFDFGTPHNPKFGPECHPNCDCGRFSEIGNSVFIQYQKKEDGQLEELPHKNVDFGGGLERITAVVNGENDIFKTDLYGSLITEVEKVTNKEYEGNEKSMRVIADHLRAAEALAHAGVIPANKLQGYVMRRLVRRMVVKMKRLKSAVGLEDFKNLTQEASILEEIGKFEKTLDKGLREVEKIAEIDGKKAFDLYQTYGSPLELTEELFTEKGQPLNKSEFEKEFAKHKELSRTASAGMFKGGLADRGVETTRLHTVTHLLHAALRKVLGDRVSQKGSNITPERLRFDFTHPAKVTDIEIAQVEDLINQEIEKGLPVSFTEMTLEEAKSQGALAFFAGKYGERVKVYTIGSADGWFSKEVCGGPHVANLSEIGGRVKIFKEEAVGGGVRRIYARILLDTSH